MGVLQSSECLPYEKLRPTKKLTRGYVDGCFDLMHSGHYNAVRQAKQICDILVVGIHSDEEITLNKAAPVMRQAERYELMKHMKWADEIVYDVPYSPSIKTLELARADFCIHGDDMPVNANGESAYDEMKNLGRLKIVKRTEGVSTTDIVGRLLLLTKDHLERTESYGSSHSEESIKTATEEAKASSFGRALLNQLPLKDKGVQMLTTSRRIAEFSSGKLPKPDDVVVYIDGVFDMFHIGHASTLEKAKALGSFLIVGIHDDATANAMKGANYPIMNLHERVLTVLACKHVDEVIMGAPLKVTDNLLRTFNISYVVQGTYSRLPFKAADSRIDVEAANAYEIPKQKGIFREVESDWAYLSTEAIAERIINNRQTYQKRNEKRGATEMDYYLNQDGKKGVRET
eukprot:gnl/MRDRNA2_/MRDRNA2_168225_c0_seq1.p1 gnl/MRDRNA2_/MRDRNA2_168225_c0~~gnl/MRDRNA2_/MRDRNA2_168225_c0_seq1.p1  ORF type:complete len:402 (-),score=76.24 gnl/MRDRNA2_/MRDRNA2_168225_c0_seq1:72-1277(-)